MVTPELVAKILAKFKTAADAEYFFDNLTSSDWVGPLREAGLFDEPEGAVKRGDSTFFPTWAPSRYLVRVAASAPEAVHAAIAAIPDNGNPRIYEDIVDAYLEFPVNLALDLFPRALHWAKITNQLLLPEKLASFSVLLTSNGHQEEGLAILKELLVILPDPRTNDYDSNDAFPFMPTPRPRIDEWDYKQILDDTIPKILNETMIEGLRLTNDLLDSFVGLSRINPSHFGPEDNSFIWRPAIEDHTQNHSGDLENSLVEAVRNGSQRIIDASPESATGIIQELESRKLTVFLRIGLHLMRTNPELLKNEIAERLGDKNLINSVGAYHEFWTLASEQIWNVDESTRIDLLTQIDSGPVGDSEDSEEIIRHWMWRRYSQLGADLPEPWNNRFNELQREFGEIPHVDFLSYFSPVMRGSTSPISREELLRLTPSDIASWAKSWEPPSDFMGPTPDSFSRELSIVVTERAAEFAESVDAYLGLKPPYVRGLIDGFREASSKGTTFSWAKVLELCLWVVAQPRGVAEDQVYQETNWVPSRRSIAHLLSQGFGSADSGLEITLRSESWAVLDILLQDPEPEREQEEEQEGQQESLMGDPASSSINMVRGMAMHAAIRYALWIRRNSPENTWTGFSAIPEVARILDSYLDPTIETTATVRAVYGQWFPWLVLLDPAWSELNSDVIFPSESNLKYLRQAAWNTYLRFSNPNDNTFELLRGQYSYSVDQIKSSSTSEERSLARLDARLAEHLMVFYWRGKLNFGDSDSLIERFFDLSSNELKADAIGFVGRVAIDHEGEISEETMNRLTSLWEQRLSSIIESDVPAAHGSELKAFGWWFRSPRFDSQWAIDQLLTVLPMTQSIECDREVARRLSELNTEFPSETVQALQLMFNGDSEGWRMGLWREYARTILEGSLASGDTDAAKIAENLIHILTARFDRSFVDLLN